VILRIVTGRTSDGRSQQYLQKDTGCYTVDEQEGGNNWAECRSKRSLSSWKYKLQIWTLSLLNVKEECYLRCSGYHLLGYLLLHDNLNNVLWLLVFGSDAIIRISRNKNTYCHRPTWYSDLRHRGILFRFPNRDIRSVCSPNRPDRLWDPPSLLCQWVLGGGGVGAFRRSKAIGSMKLNTQLLLVSG
jgi:hypothetical protein